MDARTALTSLKTRPPTSASSLPRSLSKSLRRSVEEYRSQHILPPRPAAPTNSALILNNDNDGSSNHTDQHNPSATSVSTRRANTLFDREYNADTPPRRLKPKRKGINTDALRSARVDGLHHVKKDRRDRTQKWRDVHIAEIMSETHGRRAEQPCERCTKRRGKLKECRVYKHGLGLTQQCAACLKAHTKCSNVRDEAADMSKRKEEPAESRPNSRVGPTSEDVSIALEQLSGNNWLGNTAINLLLKNVILLKDAHVVEIANTPIDASGWKKFASRYTAPDGCKMVVVPLYLSSHSHWTLLTFDLANHRAIFYDSLDLCPKHYVAAASFAIVKAFGHDWADSGWDLQYATDFPLQRDRYNCGLVVLVVCMHLMSKTKMPKDVNFRLWRLLFRRALGEAESPSELTEARLRPDLLLDDVQDPRTQREESHKQSFEDLSREVEEAVNLVSALVLQVCVEEGKLEPDLAAAEGEASGLQSQIQTFSGSPSHRKDDASASSLLETRLLKVEKLKQRSTLRDSQRRSLVRVYSAADSLHRALAAHLLSDQPTRVDPSQPVEAEIEQSRTQSSSHASNPHRASWDTVLWIIVPDNPHFSESNILSIQYYPEDLNALEHNPWLQETSLTGLGNEVVKKVDDSIYVHQGLVTMLSFKWEKLFSVRIHEWDWLINHLQNSLLPMSCQHSDGRPQNTIVFIHAATEEPSNMRDVYDKIHNMRSIHGAKIRPYPSESEWRQERQKIGDILALDKIAQSAPTEYSYRPRTCFGGGPCQIADCETTVHKRSYSAGASHVKVVRAKKQSEELTCTPGWAADDPRRSPKPTTQPSKPDKPTQKRKRSSSHHVPVKALKSSRVNGKQSSNLGPHWFHQEFVPDLHKGEFRVFIATKPDPRGIRGRSGYVVATAWTAWHWKDKSLAVRSALPQDFNKNSLTQRDLDTFSLYVFEKLRDRNKTCYESLEVGVRLDVGVADNNTQTGKRFFVNEISRWYHAHYFSHNICPEPKTQICTAFAAAFGSYVEQAMPEDGETF